jgi:hypothetical protein
VNGTSQGERELRRVRCDRKSPLFDEGIVAKRLAHAYRSKRARWHRCSTGAIRSVAGALNGFASAGGADEKDCRKQARSSRSARR